jgi:hypothetical protein
MTAMKSASRRGAAFIAAALVIAIVGAFSAYDSAMSVELAHGALE